MASLGFELLFRFLWGSLLVLVFVSRKETSERFLRIAAYIAIGTCLSAGWLLWKHLEGVKIPSGTPLSAPQMAWRLEQGFYALSLFLVSCLGYSFGRARVIRILSFFGFLLSPWLVLPLNSFAHSINFVSGSLILGAAFGGQYLGHWYLTVPGMHIRELKKVSTILFVAVTVKIVEIVTSFWLWSSTRSNANIVDDMGRPLGIDFNDINNLDQLNLANSTLGLQGDIWIGLGSFGVVLIVSRVLWGIIAPFILGYMVKKTVEIRSTQSATGILYALCVAVIFGEGAAIYMRGALGLLI
jgi:hypothetical protein